MLMKSNFVRAVVLAMVRELADVITIAALVARDFSHAQFASKTASHIDCR
jgi:hypothetical protein